jgi:hypothetical protein
VVLQTVAVVSLPRALVDDDGRELVSNELSVMQMSAGMLNERSSPNTGLLDEESMTESPEDRQIVGRA